MEKKIESNFSSEPMDSFEPEAHCSTNINLKPSNVNTSEEKPKEREFKNNNNTSFNSLQSVPVVTENSETNIPIVRVEPRIQPQEIAVRAVSSPTNSAANFFRSYDPMAEEQGTMPQPLPEFENTIDPLPADFNVNMYSLDVAGYTFSFDDLDFIFD